MEKIVFYILDGKTPVIEPDPQKWAEWFRSSDRQLKTSQFDQNGLPVTISTIFLGMSPNIYPRLFETTVIGGLWHGKSKLYHTYDDAMVGHDMIEINIRHGEWI